MKNDNIFYDTVWSSDELKRFRKMFTNWEGTETEPYEGYREVTWLSRSTENVVNYPNPDKLLEKYCSYLSPRVGRQFAKSLDKGYSVDAKLALYREGHEYIWHSDDCVHPINKWMRIISSITYLNDDYEGGGTEFEDHIITPVSGKTLIFPSAFTHPHRGLVVTAGIKKILVMHFWI